VDFFFPALLLFCGTNPAPEQKMPGRGKRGHINADFRDEGNRGKKLDNRNGHKQFDLSTEGLGESEDEGFEIFLTKRQGIHIGTDDFQLLHLLGTHQTVYGSLYFIGRGFAESVDERRDIEVTVRMEQQLLCDSGSALAEYVGEHIVELAIGDGKAVLRAVLLAGGEICQLRAIAHKVAKLPDFKGRDKTAGNKIGFEDVGDPLCVAHVGFLAPYGFDIFGMREDDFAGCFEDVVDGDPIFPCGFHTNIFAVVFRQPCRQPAKITGKRGKPALFVSRDAFAVGCRDTGDDEGLVDIDPATDGIDDLRAIAKTPPHKKLL
jgi:hypothetical protein